MTSYISLESIVSVERLSRYCLACNGNKRKAMNLYRLNNQLSLEMFAVVGAFEVALRNRIDDVMRKQYGIDWLRNAVQSNGMFDVVQCRDHARIIRAAYEKLMRQNRYTHNQLLSQLEFGVWKYMFSNPQFNASGRILLQVFPGKPRSSREKQFNQSFFFNELDRVNSLRNRIAHHEPICFRSGQSVVTSVYIVSIYDKIDTLLRWMGIDISEYVGRPIKLNMLIERLNKY